MLRGCASHVLTAISLVENKGQILTPTELLIPLTDLKKFVTGDYVGDP